MDRYRNALCLCVVALALSGPAHAADKDGISAVTGGSCGDYLGAYCPALS
jgi:hypothetical protein